MSTSSILKGLQDAAMQLLKQKLHDEPSMRETYSRHALERLFNDRNFVLSTNWSSNIELLGIVLGYETPAPFDSSVTSSDMRHMLEHGIEVATILKEAQEKLDAAYKRVDAKLSPLPTPEGDAPPCQDCGGYHTH